MAEKQGAATRSGAVRRDALGIHQRELGAVIDLLGLAVVPLEPPGHLKSRVLASLENRSPAEVEVRPVVSLFRSDHFPWVEGPAPGVRMKSVFLDPVARSHCRMIEIAPGASFPDHAHEGLEETLVLRGSVSVAGRVLREGDYCRSEKGTQDWDIVSSEGALLFVTTWSTAQESRPAR